MALLIDDQIEDDLTDEVGKCLKEFSKIITLTKKRSSCLKLEEHLFE